MVDINPSSFAEDGGVLDLSMEEVVAFFLDTEKRRHKTAKEDENQQEDTITYRVVPMGLVMSLDATSRSLGITRALLTRCLSHQIAAWFDSMDRLRDLVELFNIAHDAAYEYGYPDLYDDMHPKYIFANTAPRTVSFRTIRWVKNKLFAISQPVGIPAGALFIIGLCYALTRTAENSKGTVDKYLSAEVSQFLLHSDEQSIRIRGFDDMIRWRAKKEGHNYANA